MFSNLPSSSISCATETPSLVIDGAPNDLSITTFLPFGPSVTLTAFASVLTPDIIKSLASEPNFTSFADIIFLLYSSITATISSSLITRSFSSATVISAPEY